MGETRGAARFLGSFASGPIQLCMVRPRLAVGNEALGFPEHSVARTRLGPESMSVDRIALVAVASDVLLAHSERPRLSHVPGA